MSQATKGEKAVILGKGDLTIEQVVAVARYRRVVAEIGDETQDDAAKESYDRVMASYNWVKDVVDKNEQLPESERKAYYGINTGFGSKAGRRGLGESLIGDEKSFDALLPALPDLITRRVRSGSLRSCGKKTSAPQGDTECAG